MLQTPPPPSISPRQMTLLRIVTSMAWSDGDLATEEVEVMLDRFSQVFATNETEHHHLRQELRDYLMQNIPLEELTPRLTEPTEKELVLRLGYEVIASSARVPTEAVINEEESAAYQKLIQLLNLPSDRVQQIEAEVKAEANGTPLIDRLTHQLEKFAH